MSLEENLNDYPWLLFKLYNISYAVSSKDINAIAHLPNNITIMPDKDEHIRGVMEFRGAHIKLIDLRALLNIDSIDVEIAKFGDMLDERKQDHINWITELERCVNEHDQFKLATDPHKCKFGKWYDTYHSTSNNINFTLKQIEDPHEKFHRLANEINMTLTSKDSDQSKYDAVQKILNRGKEEYMTKIIDVLDDVKQIVATHTREMVIAFEDCNGEFFGVIVDEVLSVDEIDLLNGNNTNNAVLRNRFIQGIARTKKSKELVLILNHSELADA